MAGGDETAVLGGRSMSVATKEAGEDGVVDIGRESGERLNN